MYSRVRAVAKVLEGTSDAAYAVDERGYLIGWNEASERLLGHQSRDVLGRPCCEILRGIDVFGNRYCMPRCPLILMAHRQQPVQHFPIDLSRSDGSLLRAICFILVIPGRSSDLFTIIHLFHPADESTVRGSTPSPLGKPRITPREHEVLGLLAEGRSTRQMAEQMGVREATVRKHVQNLLKKLGATTRLSAVLKAFERDLL